MPRKKPVLSKSELCLMLRIAKHIDFLLVKQLLFGITSITTEKALKDFDNASQKLASELTPKGPNRYFSKDHNLNSKFFRTLDSLLKQLSENKSPALETVSWRARNLRHHLGGLAKLFPAAK